MIMNKPQAFNEPCTGEGQIDRFVFLDERPWPFMVGNELGRYWLYYWAESHKEFKPLRTLDGGEQERFRPLALSDDKAALYLDHGKRSPVPKAPKSSSDTESL